MIDWLSAIFAGFGFYLIALRLLSEHIGHVFGKNIFRKSRDEAYFFILLSFLAWAAASGLGALVLVWGYFANISLLSRYCLNGVIGFVCILTSWPVLSNYRGVIKLFSSVKLERKEKLVLVFTACLLLMYLYRMTLPWADWDETSCYGYVSKLIASGRTFQDIFREDTYVGMVCSHLIQSWDALLYGLVNDTYLVRFSRLINLLFCSVGIFAFLRLIQVKRFWSLVAVAGFLSTPELSYLALSLKVDSVVMMFELAAFLSIIMAFIIYWHEEKSKNLSGTAFYLSTVALLCAAFAFGNRFSGVISVTLCASCAWFFLTRQTKRPLVSLGSVLGLCAIFMFIAAPGYWVNIIVYNNPNYPIKSFWPFQNGAYLWTVETLKAGWNIVGLPPVVLQIYLIFALGTGLELLAKALPFLNCLPMAIARTQSMGWPYPFILCIFLWPFFMRKQRVLNLIVGIFLFQFIFWSLLMHYSRLLVAAATLTILAAVIMADQDLSMQGRVRRYLQKILKFWIIFSLVISIVVQSWWFVKRYWGAFLIGAEKRYHAEVSFLKTKDYLEKNEPTLKEVRMLNSFLLHREVKPVVYVVTYSRDVIQILFDKDIHIKAFNSAAPLVGSGKYILINPNFLEGNNTLDKRRLQRYFPVHLLTTPETGWELYTIAAKD